MKKPGMGYHAICRSCGTKEDLLEAKERGGRMWRKLTCGHWEKSPHPGEFVLFEPGGALKLWGSFEHDPADL